MPIDALSVLCAQLTHDPLAIAKFLFYKVFEWSRRVMRMGLAVSASV